MHLMGKIIYTILKSAQDEIRTRTVARHPLKVVRLPVSPPGQGTQK